jgi:hypothetical protein
MSSWGDFWYRTLIYEHIGNLAWWSQTTTEITNPCVRDAATVGPGAGVGSGNSADAAEKKARIARAAEVKAVLGWAATRVCLRRAVVMEGSIVANQTWSGTDRLQYREN